MIIESRTLEYFSVIWSDEIHLKECQLQQHNYAKLINTLVPIYWLILKISQIAKDFSVFLHDFLK